MSRIVYENDLTIQILVDGGNTSKLAKFRQIVKDDIPTVAIETVRILRNTTGLDNEILAHSLSLAVIWSEEADLMRSIEECPAASLTSPDCSVHYRLDKYCAGPTSCPVTSDDFKWIDGPKIDGQPLSLLPISQISELNVDPMVFYELQPGQEIIAEMFAYKRSVNGAPGSIRHAKWSPVSTVFYKRIPRLLIQSSRMSPQTQRRVVEKCGEDLIYFDQIHQRYAIRRHEQLDEVGCPSDSVSFSPNNDQFLFTLEVTGALNPRRVLLDGLEIYRISGDSDFDFLESLLL